MRRMWGISSEEVDLYVNDRSCVEYIRVRTRQPVVVTAIETRILYCKTANRCCAFVTHSYYEFVNTIFILYVNMSKSGSSPGSII